MSSGCRLQVNLDIPFDLGDRSLSVDKDDNLVRLYLGFTLAMRCKKRGAFGLPFFRLSRNN